jgi:hypothetical protein
MKECILRGQQRGAAILVYSYLIVDYSSAGAAGAAARIHVPIICSDSDEPIWRDHAKGIPAEKGRL